MYNQVPCTLEASCKDDSNKHTKSHSSYLARKTAFLDSNLLVSRLADRAHYVNNMQGKVEKALCEVNLPGQIVLHRRDLTQMGFG